MLSLQHASKSALMLFGLALGLGGAEAQPGPNVYWTIEAKIDQSDHVVIATIDKLVTNVIVPKGGRTKRGTIDYNGQIDYTVILKVDEVLKGNLKGNVDDLEIIRSSESDKRYEEWSKAQTSILWFLGPSPKAGKRRSWDMLRLGKPVASESRFVPSLGIPMFSMEFTVLKDGKALLARARAYSKISMKVLPTHVIQIPEALSRRCDSGGRWNELIVPVEPSLEKRAHRLISSPQDFMPKGEKLNPKARYLFRFGGVNSLRYFKSEANAALLRSLLDDPLEDYVSRNRVYPIRTKAFEILLHWGVEAPLPKSSEEITALDLAGTDVTDEALKRVANLRNLSTLNLRHTKVTHEGLKHLSGLRKLTSLHLGQGKLSDAKLRVLREMGMLHAVWESTGKGGNRPGSAEEVTSLALFLCPITDAGLREVVGLTNLGYLDLRQTRVTDAGLQEVAGLKKLRILHLQGTRATKDGIAELQRALPNCKINY